MKTVWKYELQQHEFTIRVPFDGKILYVENQYENICIWIEVDTEQPLIERSFFVYGTGHEINEINLVYIGSVKLSYGDFIFHIYEKIYKKSSENA